jgi:hypothetical protein
MENEIKYYENIPRDFGFYFVDKNKNENIYLENYLKLFTSKIPDNITVNKFQNCNDLIIFSSDNAKSIKNIRFILLQPLFPIILNDKNILLNLFLWKFINGKKEDSIEELVSKILKIIGVIVYRKKEDFNYNFKKNKDIKKFETFKRKIDNNYNLPHINPKLFGWHSKETKHNLKYAINLFKNKKKTIVELGSWYGMSTITILKNMNENDQLIVCDKFQNHQQSKYIAKDKKAPFNDFYLDYPRIETFLKNIEPYRKNKNVYMYGGDIYSLSNEIIKDGFKPDIWFIDFEKNDEKLAKFINNILSFTPESIIVGDDYIFNSVKRAFYNINEKKVSYNESYIIYKNINKENYWNNFPENIIKLGKKLSKIKNMKFENVIKLNPEFIAYKVSYLFENKEFKKGLKYINYVDFNFKYKTLNSSNTLYHILFFHISELSNKDNEFEIFEKMNLIKEFSKKQPIKRINNLYGNYPHELLIRGSRTKLL